MKHWTQANTSDFAYSISLDFFTQIDDSIQESGISRKEFSKKMEVTPSAVSQILNSPPDNPHVETLVQYARSAGRKVAIVVYNDNDPDNDKGPIYSGVFEAAWKALGRPRDLSVFSESEAVDSRTDLIVPSRAETNKLVARSVGIEMKPAASHGDYRNVTGDLYAQAQKATA